MGEKSRCFGRCRFYDPDNRKIRQGFLWINLKTKYAPYEVNEDFLIETILDRAFVRGRLVNQKPANPLDIDELYDYWEKKAQSLKK